MQTNKKQSPKSCSCQQCRRGKGTGPGNAWMKSDERAFRHNSKIDLQSLINSVDDEDLEEYNSTSAPIGNYYD